jgi:hypothetical protein
VCRSNRPIRIVGGHNDAAIKMPISTEIAIPFRPN